MNSKLIFLLLITLMVGYIVGSCVAMSDYDDCPPCRECPEEPDWDSMPEEWGYVTG